MKGRSVAVLAIRVLAMQVGPHHTARVTGLYCARSGFTPAWPGLQADLAQ